MSLLKNTPGVYIDEIDAFPPSIVQAATAIPAFIGYTQKVPDPNEPTKVRSLLEFNHLFGGPPEPSSITIDLGAQEYKVDESDFKLYNCLRLFYANGGNECYIVSIGTYENKPDFSSSEPFNTGIDLLEKVDDITLILFPDAINLGASKLGDVQKHALGHCRKLMDRFTIMDVIQKNRNGNAHKLDNDCEDFREAVGNQNLKYGAAYYPYLKTSYGYTFRYRQIMDGGADFLTLYADDSKLTALLDKFHKLINDLDINNGLPKKWKTKVTDNPKIKDLNSRDMVDEYTTAVWKLLATLGKPNKLKHQGLIGLLKNNISLLLKPYAQKLVDFRDAFKNLEKYDEVADAVIVVEELSQYDKSKFTDPWGDISAYAISAPNPYEGNVISKKETTPDGSREYNAPDFKKIQAKLDKLHNQVIRSIDAVLANAKEYELKEENDLVEQIPIYPKIITKLSKVMNTVPPSGAIAGIYARVDARKGVWIAPANESINGIMGLTDDISHFEQATMNVHETGKSINAIRKFTGQGLLVWGARTLDGNSNDWRYINVRRLALSIEKSAKKACFKFVFAPNVKQTWVNVKGMIQSFLTNLWGDGALAGEKAEDAFFVNVGLNETMTANDINEGKMIVKIGFVPPRPAEVIILEFTQIQQKS